MGWTYALLATAGIVGSVVSLAYYGGVLQSMYASVRGSEVPEVTEPPAGERLAAHSAEAEDEPASDARGTVRVVALTALMVVVLGLVPLFAGTSVLLAPFIVR